MKFNTDLYHVTSQNHCFGGYQNSYWVLWFTEADMPDDRQAIIERHQFCVKPTRKQIKKLRKEFKKFVAEVL